MSEIIRLSAESTKKFDALMRSAKRELGMVLVKSFLMALGAIVPITLLSVMFGLITTSFPMLAGFLTAILIQLQYVNPSARSIGERYAKAVKEVIEEERRRQAEEG